MRMIKIMITTKDSTNIILKEKRHNGKDITEKISRLINGERNDVNYEKGN